MKEEDNKILSVEDLLHLRSDKHQKESMVMPDINTNQYVLKQKPKVEAVRNFATKINITEEQRRQFNQGSTAPCGNAILAEKSRQAMEIAKLHAEKEAVEQAKAAGEKTANTTRNTEKLAEEIKSGNFEFSFAALIDN
jgi:hypothetical protein